jgi:tetratricopeptide (TPR) repeat protein
VKLVGREAAIAALDAALAEAAEGRGRLVVIAGEPGIGKSAVVDELAARAERAGRPVNYGRAWEFADSPPYFAVRAGLKALGIATDDAEPFALWEDVLDALASSGPRVWIVEDVHAADLMTLDLLAFLARPVRSLPVVIAVTRRDRDPRITASAEQRLVRIAREGTRIDLGPLDETGVAALAANAAGHRIEAATVKRLVELSGGNPLFVVELARVLDGRAAALPETLRQVVLDRVTLLPDRVQTLVTAAAVLGRELGAALLARVAERPPQQIVDELAPALRAGVLVERAPGELAFSHVVVRDAIEEAAPRAVRVALHRRAAAALAEQPETPATLVERARHTLEALEDATDVGVVEQTIELLAKRGAYDRAFALATRLHQLRGGGGLRLAELAVAAGQATEARRLCEQVMADARARGDRELFARAALVAGSEIRPAAVDPQFIAQLEEARAGLADGPLAWRVDARLAAARQPALDSARPIALAEAAIAAARRSGDQGLLCEVLDVGGAALVDFAPIARRLEVWAELLATARAVDDRPRQLRAHARTALDLVELGDFLQASDHIERMVGIARELGHPRHRWRALLVASMRATAEGRLADSERLTVEVELTAATVDEPALRTSLSGHVGHRAMVMHDDDAMRALIPTIAGSTGNNPFGVYVETAIRAAIYARLEDREATARELGRLQLDGFGSVMLVGSYYRNLLVEAIALAGSDVVRRRVLALLDGLAVAHIHAGHAAIQYQGPVALARGTLHAALGDRTAAERELRAALAITEANGLAPWTAHTCYQLGTLRRSRRRR